MIIYSNTIVLQLYIIIALCVTIVYYNTIVTQLPSYLEVGFSRKGSADNRL